EATSVWRTSARCRKWLVRVGRGGRSKKKASMPIHLGVANRSARCGCDLNAINAAAGPSQSRSAHATILLAPWQGGAAPEQIAKPIRARATEKAVSVHGPGVTAVQRIDEARALSGALCPGGAEFLHSCPRILAPCFRSGHRPRAIPSCCPAF